MRVRAWAAVVLALAGCESVIGARFDDARPLGAASDSGVGGASDAASDADAAVCNFAKPPKPPSLHEPNDVAEATVVLDSVDFGEDKDAKGQPKFWTQGYDLDDNCADRGEPPTCQPPAWTKGDAKDGPEGQDNGVGKMMASQTDVLQLGLPAISSAKFTTEIQAGNYAPLGIVHVSEWGGFDDDQVCVEWYRGFPAKQAPGGGFTPKLDGSDVWAVDGEGAAAIEIDDAAYVNGRVLVARFDKVRLPFGTLFVEARDVVLTGSLDAGPGGKFVLKNGIVAGWSHVDEVIGIIPAITKTLFGISMCADNANFPLIKNFVCRVADANGEAGECRGISFAIRFDSVPTTIGDVAPLPSAVECPPSTDPKTKPCSMAPDAG